LLVLTAITRHPAANVIIENQVAMGDATVVPATLDRQDAVHEFP